MVTMAFAVLLASAQTADDYIVKTKGVKKPEVATAQQSETEAEAGEGQKAEEPQDFIGKNFKYYSLCDWREGMRFMVMPEKYDLIVKTFCDASTGKEVSSMTLRHKIMEYKGHTVSADGHAHVHFLCQDNGRRYYYEIPSGSFEDYCYGKLGVPTLAYLGDVDIARDKLLNKTLVTKSTTYCVDTEYDGDGFREVKVPLNQTVKVTAVGVGTRSFPVKIIVEDEKGNEFYQNVAISKTNSGMRDDEFVMDNTKHAFYGSFDLHDVMMSVNSDIASYVGKTIHTKYVTGMITQGDGRERTVRVPKMTTFTIDVITPIKDSKYATLSLTEMESRRVYYKKVSFENPDDVVLDDSRKDELFGYVFGMGEGLARNTSQAARAAIRAGRVIQGMSEDEVQLAVGEPDRTAADNSGRYDWIYTRSKGKLLIVQFGRNGKVEGYRTAQGTSTRKPAARRKK